MMAVLSLGRLFLLQKVDFLGIPLFVQCLQEYQGDSGHLSPGSLLLPLIHPNQKQNRTDTFSPFHNYFLCMPYDWQLGPISPSYNGFNRLQSSKLTFIRLLYLFGQTALYRFGQTAGRSASIDYRNMVTSIPSAFTVVYMQRDGWCKVGETGLLSRLPLISLKSRHSPHYLEHPLLARARPVTE